MNPYLETLNDSQIKAVRQPLIPTMVVAGPGTGKTKTLIGRIIALMEEPYNIAPENILAVTFTNQATNEMQERLEQFVGRQAFRITVSTVHGFCLRLLQKHGELVYIPDDFLIADEMTQFRLLSRCVNSQDIRSLHHIRDIIAQYRFNVSFPLAVDDKVILAWTQSYEQQLTRHHMIDFDQMLLKAYDLLESNDDVVAMYSNRYRAILLDEFQDIDSIQYQIFKTLAQEHQNIFAVCDEDQSIYAFRGADVTNITRFQQDFGCSKENGNLIVLNQNYRSQQSIINLSSSLMSPHRSTPKEITAVFDRKETPTYHKCADEAEERQLLFQLIQKYHAQGIAYSDIAILCPTNYLAESYEPDFIEQGIPYRLHTSQSLADFDDLERTKAFLTLIYQKLLEEAGGTEGHIFYGYDLAYERFFMMFSELAASTFQLIKYQQGKKTFNMTIDWLIFEAKDQDSEWGLDIEKEKFLSLAEATNGLITSLFEEVAFKKKDLTSILQVIEKYLPVHPTSLLFACDTTLQDPNKIDDVKNSLGIFYWFAQEATPASNVRVIARDQRVANTAAYMLQTTLRKADTRFFEIDFPVTGECQSNLKCLMVKTENPECTLYFSSGLYGFFKFLQSLYHEMTYQETFGDYLAVDIRTDVSVDGEFVSAVSLYRATNDVVIESKDFVNAEKLPFADFVVSIKDDFCQSAPITALLTENLPIIYVGEAYIFQLFHKVFPMNVAFNFFGLHTFLKYRLPSKQEEALKRFRVGDDFVVSVSLLLKMINKHEAEVSRKTALEYLVPIFHLGLYFEYIAEPDKKGVNFVSGSEALSLFLWGNSHFDAYTYSEEMMSYWRIQKADISDFLGLFQQDILLQMPFEQGFPALLALSLRYDSSDILANIRDFLNGVSLIGVGQLFDIDAVNVSTIHASKGKEYLVGLALGLEDGILPSTHSLRFMSTHNNRYLLNEQRRVLYVALTRVKQYLHMIHTETRRGRKNQQSRFLNELQLGQ